MKNIVFSFALLFVVNYTYSQFESADITASFTEDVQSDNLDSTMIDSTIPDSSGMSSNVTRRRVVVRIENLDSLAIHGCSVEVLDANTDYILSRKIGNKYTPGSMGFVRYENNRYYIDAGYFREDTEVKIYIRLEDYKKALSDLVTLTVLPYEE